MTIRNKNIDPLAAIEASKLKSADIAAAQLGADSVETAKIKNANVTAAKLEEGLHQFKKVTLTNSEIKNVRATPIELISAPGASKLVVVHQMYLHLDAGSEALTESVDNLVIQYGDGQDISGSIESTGFIDQTADTWISVLPVAQAASAAGSIGFNKKVEIFNTGDGEIAGNASNDATLDVYVSYSIADFS